MEDGRLILRVEAGQVVAVLQNAGIDDFYERMFRNAYRRARRSQNSVQAGINIIVFGAFWIEAQANAFLRESLYAEVKTPGFGNALWTALRRAPLLDKLELFHSLATTELAEQYVQLRSEVRAVLDLRNRLAHFKDENTQLGGPVAGLEEAMKVFGMADDPDLIKQLKAPAVLQRGRAVMDTLRWMARVHRSHAKVRGGHIKITRRSPKAPSPNQRLERPPK